MRKQTYTTNDREKEKGRDWVSAIVLALDWNHVFYDMHMCLLRFLTCECSDFAFVVDSFFSSVAALCDACIVTCNIPLRCQP